MIVLEFTQVSCFSNFLECETTTRVFEQFLLTYYFWFSTLTFPFDSKQVPYGTRSWLSNSSFSENLLPPSSSFPASKAIEQLYGKDVLDEVEKREGKGTEGERVRIEPGPETASSTPDSDFSEGESSRQKRRKGKRHRKRKEEKEEERKRRKKRKQTGDEIQIGSLEAQSVDRKAGVKAWADGKENVAKEYYVDTRGDRDNLAFGSLYRSAQQSTSSFGVKIRGLESLLCLYQNQVVIMSK